MANSDSGAEAGGRTLREPAARLMVALVVGLTGADHKPIHTVVVVGAVGRAAAPGLILSRTPWEAVVVARDI